MVLEYGGSDARPLIQTPAAFRWLKKVCFNDKDLIKREVISLHDFANYHRAYLLDWLIHYLPHINIARFVYHHHFLY